MVSGLVSRGGNLHVSELWGLARDVAVASEAVRVN